MILSISGLDVIIDDESLHLLELHSYTLQTREKGSKPRSYFIRSLIHNGRKTTTSLHRDIMKCVNGDGKLVDHINGNTLDNRLENLRLCNINENARNREMNRNSTSGYKGVTFSKHVMKWHAQIRHDGKKLCLGYYDSKESAYEAYREASGKYHGKFGRTK